MESCIEVKFSDIDQSIMLGQNKDILLSFNTVDYEICFNFDKRGCKVKNELVKLKCGIICGVNQKIGDNEIIIKNNDGNIQVEFLEDIKELEISEIIPDALVDIVSQNFKNDNTPIINSALSTIPIKWGDLFKNIALYDFDPKFCKNINATNNEKLTKHGGNLPVMLKNILNDEKKKKEFLIYYTNMLPYVKEVSVDKILDEERIFMIVEKYNDVKIPAPFISDGTSTIMAIEEPERHIHPSMINQLMLMMESVDKQVIITTHSPELLKYSKLESILFISRDGNGFSNIKRVMDNDVVKPFIEELGIDSVFVNN